jgi:hypothetical protein
MTLTDGFRRALRAWPMALLLTGFSVILTPALELRNRMAAADFGIGGFPFNVSNREYYQALTSAETAMLALLFLAWVFLAGGIIDRLARDQRSPSRRFFAASGACFGPLVRLALIMLAVYAALLTWIEPAMARAADTENTTVRMALFGTLAILIFLISLVFDYARVRLVIEDRRSAIGALAASLRLIRAWPGRVLAAQAIFWLLLVAWMWARALTPPGDSLFAQTLTSAGEIFFKLALVATQAATYQSVLASAGWVARADQRWPDDASSDPRRGPLHPA